MLHSHVKEFLIELKMKGSSIHTVKNYNFHLNKFIKYVEKGELDYATLTTKQIKRFRNQMVEDNLKPKSINAILSALKSFYDFLVEEGEVQGNPIITRRLRVKEGQSLPDFMSVEELEIFTGWLKGVLLAWHVSPQIYEACPLGMLVPWLGLGNGRGIAHTLVFALILLTTGLFFYGDGWRG